MPLCALCLSAEPWSSSGVMAYAIGKFCAQKMKASGMNNSRAVLF